MSKETEQRLFNLVTVLIGLATLIVTLIQLTH